MRWCRSQSAEVERPSSKPRTSAKTARGDDGGAAAAQDECAPEEHHLLGQAAVHAVEPHCARAALRVHLLDPAVHEPHRRIGAQQRDLRFQLAREPFVVRVQEREHVAAGARRAGVAGGGDAAIGLPHGGHAAVVAVEDGGGVVGRAVVDDDHLGRRQRLREDALDAAGQEARVVERRDHDRDFEAHAAGPRASVASPSRHPRKVCRPMRPR